jgi:hypothetical protein
VAANTSSRSTAAIIDELYQTSAFQNHRAALGGARSFAKSYRNVASHPAKTAKEAADKVRKCRTGFLESLKVSGELRAAMQTLGYRVNIQ